MKRIIYAVAVLLTATSCQEKRKTTDSVEKIPIEVSTPIVREVTLTREYPGFLESDITIDIVARVNGTLEVKS